MFGALHVFRIYRAIRFLFLGPFILLFLIIVNWLTTPGHWWVQWAALGIGIAWLVCLMRVLRAIVILGGIAALATYLAQRKSPTPGTSSSPGAPPPPIQG
jgi:hypothetical protein